MGNLLVPNSNYCAFEDWIMPILDALKAEQEQEGARWTPSKVPSSSSWMLPMCWHQALIRTSRIRIKSFTQGSLPSIAFLCLLLVQSTAEAGIM